ncbi:MAG: class I SAM-dependent methyltransferase, partial [candidate division Zixibacteria bacterium]|nr:class I SAM-dependent methyltransferase [candidate division Zixibacteria bacterium]
NVKRVVIRDGLRKDKPFSLRLYSPTEMKELLKRAGFKLHQIYSDWDANPFTSNSRRMIIIAKKVK